MSPLPWFKCYPRDFREGMVGLTPEERGAYITLLLLIYERGEAIPDDESWLAAQLWCSVRTWKKVRAALVVKGKLFALNYNGADCLMNRRAADELTKTSNISSVRADAGREGGKKSASQRAEKSGRNCDQNEGSENSPPQSNKNNDLGEANASVVVKLTPSKNQPDITDYQNSSVVPSNEETTGGEPPADLDKRAWDEAAGLLVGQGGMSPPSARSFFGRLLAQHDLRARDLLGALGECFANCTQDPQGYLTKSAQARGRRRQTGPPKRVGFV